MSTNRFTPDELQQLHALAKQWAKIVSRHAFGETGPELDVDFRTMEQIASAAARGLTEGTLELLLQQHAQKLPDQQPCPTCERLCPTQPRSRTLVAEGAEVQQAERIAHCSHCRRDFFPLRPHLGLDEHAYSSTVVEKIVTATARFPSFADATAAIHMAQIAISERQVERLAHQVGQEMIAQRDRHVIEQRRRQLPTRVDVIPAAVVVEVDGGRARTRAAGQGPGVHAAKNHETKIACLATLTSREFDTDPQPEPPPSWVCPRRVERLMKQMKGQAGDGTELEMPVSTSDDPVKPKRAEQSKRWSPERRVRTCVASVEPSSSFGPMMAAEAQQRQFYEATRKAFVADGAAYNWSIHHGYFRDFEPIVDFLHVLCYVYAASRAVSADERSGWSQYLVWMRACWQGRGREVVTELEAWQSRLGLPPPSEATTAVDRRDPRRVVAEAVSYLTNTVSRMDYPRYRRLGLPTTSSLVESLVGEFNTRVKSKQKHWNRPQGAESILQLRAAVLSEDDRLHRFFANRTGCATRKRPPTTGKTETPVQTAA